MKTPINPLALDNRYYKTEDCHYLTAQIFKSGTRPNSVYITYPTGSGIGLEMIPPHTHLVAKIPKEAYGEEIFVFRYEYPDCDEIYLYFIRRQDVINADY